MPTLIVLLLDMCTIRSRDGSRDWNFSLVLSRSDASREVILCFGLLLFLYLYLYEVIISQYFLYFYNIHQLSYSSSRSAKAYCILFLNFGASGCGGSVLSCYLSSGYSWITFLSFFFSSFFFYFSSPTFSLYSSLSKIYFFFTL